MTDPNALYEHIYDAAGNTERHDVATQVNRNNHSLKQWIKKCLVVVIVSSVLITIVLSIIMVVFRTKIEKVFVPPPKDCSELPAGSCSGVYTILPKNGSKIAVFCEMNTNHGGWTTIQRRYDGTVNFYRFWNDYKTGFGNISGEHWLGNDNLHVILRQKSYQVRFDIEDFYGNTAYATYTHIYVGDESSNYKLSLSGYSGTAGDAMVDMHDNPMNGMMFSTPGRDNDLHHDNCGVLEMSGWWHASCTYANINGGLYMKEYSEKSLHWKTWKITGQDRKSVV